MGTRLIIPSSGGGSGDAFNTDTILTGATVISGADLSDYDTDRVPLVIIDKDGNIITAKI